MRKLLAQGLERRGVDLSSERLLKTYKEKNKKTTILKGFGPIK